MLKTSCLIGLVACLSFSSVHAGLFSDDEARTAILELRQRIETNRTTSDAAIQRLNDELKKTADDSSSHLRSAVLELFGQIEILRAETARLRGQNEQLMHDVAQWQSRQKDLSQGVDERLRKIEPARVSVDNKEFMAEPAETQEFDAALALLRKGDFAVAVSGFSNLLKRYPDSGYKPSALFWLGNAQYAVRNYREAIANFRTLVNLSAQHMRAPEALLSIANCYVELKDLKTAKKTLEELIKTYPQSEAASAGQERLSKLKQL